MVIISVRAGKMWSSKEGAMATIDVDKLRKYLKGFTGTAAFSGFPGAILDTIDIESMSPRQLCKKAESLGIDLNKFRIDK